MYNVIENSTPSYIVLFWTGAFFHTHIIIYSLTSMFITINRIIIFGINELKHYLIEKYLQIIGITTIISCSMFCIIFFY